MEKINRYRQDLCESAITITVETASSKHWKTKTLASLFCRLYSLEIHIITHLNNEWNPDRITKEA